MYKIKSVLNQLIKENADDEKLSKIFWITLYMKLLLNNYLI